MSISQNGNHDMAQGIKFSLLGIAEISPNRLYTTKEAAAILAMPLRSVSSYLKKGVIPGQKLGPRQARITGITLLKIMAMGDSANV